MIGDLHNQPCALGGWIVSVGTRDKDVQVILVYNVQLYRNFEQ